MNLTSDRDKISLIFSIVAFLFACSMSFSAIAEQAIPISSGVPGTELNAEVNAAESNREIAASDPEVTAGETASQEQDASTLQTFASLLATRADKQTELDSVKATLATTRDEVGQQELGEQAKQMQAELDEVNEQIGILATGVSDKEFDLAGGQEIDLQSEFEQLLQPFVIMLKSATAEARQIEQLRHKLLTADAHIDIAEKALAGMQDLKASVQEPSLAGELTQIQEDWQGRLAAASDLKTTMQHQLDARLNARDNPSDDGSSAFGDFFRDRGLSLVMGIGSAILLFTLLKLIGSAFRYAGNKGGVQRTFQVRLSALLFNIFCFIAAIGVMLYIFNMRNDWLLLGLVMLLVIAILWMSLKMLPEMMEQITLLLNLGAVQEGERLMFEGIPWHVEKLDVYTDLVNPELSGGTVTLPVRELLGLHSRPAGDDEDWFPTQLNDWVKTEDGAVAQVVFQSPEFVQLLELGGARVSVAAPAFFESAPTNLSSDSRVEIEFGISYKHQKAAAKEIPEKLAAYVEKGLLGGLLGSDELLAVNVELLQCADSSLTYEVEADITGAAAAKYEDVERALTRLCLEACNENNWEIPFPQLVVHRPA